MGSFLDKEFRPPPLKIVHRIWWNSLYYNIPYRWLGMWRTSRACVGSSWTAWAASPLSLRPQTQGNLLVFQMLSLALHDHLVRGSSLTMTLTQAQPNLT